MPHQGVIAVIADSLTRAGVFDALTGGTGLDWFLAAAAEVRDRQTVGGVRETIS